MNKPSDTKNRTIGLNKKTVRKLNEGELSQVAGALFGSSDVGCTRCSTSGTFVRTCSVY